MRLTREDFQHAISEARKNDDDYASIPFRFGIPNAKEALIAGLEEVMHHKVEWLADYDQIVNWLTDNQGKGLLLIGPPGVGKSEICMKVIPLIFRMALHKVFSRYQATELCNEATYRSSLRQRFIAIDDFGIEGTFYDYGNSHIVFSEIVDGGKLYPEEHRRKFEIKNDIFKVGKSPVDDNKLVLTVNRQPIGEWFKEQ